MHSSFLYFMQFFFFAQFLGICAPFPFLFYCSVAYFYCCHKREHKMLVFITILTFLPLFSLLVLMLFEVLLPCFMSEIWHKFTMIFEFFFIHSISMKQKVSVFSMIFKYWCDLDDFFVRACNALTQNLYNLSSCKNVCDFSR